MTADLNVPLDREHDEATVLREQIRAWFAEARRRVAVRTPREMPR